MIPGANVAIMAAAAAHEARVREIRALREAGATSPSAAVAREKEAMGRLKTAIEAGAVRRTDDGRVWLDEAAYAVWTTPKRPAKRLIIALLALLGIAIAAAMLLRE
jgi:hypothetical protein